MSYEGYEQFLCEKGHYWTENSLNCFDLPHKEKCPKCNKNPVWWHMVDTTNDSGNPVKLKVKKKINGYCSSCGEEHICEITYRIPKRKGVILK